MNIVIIDDTEINLALLRHLVDKLGPHTTSTFVDPMQGLSHCLASSPDLLIVDYMMPQLDGVELIRKIRATPGCQEIPILMITASDQISVRHRALHVGASDFLSKPVDNIEFQARVRNMLALRASQKRLEDHASWLAEEVLKATEEIVSRERETIVRLSRAAEFRDPETGAHILRMAHYAWLIAVRLGLPVPQQQLLLDAAPMHDVGKLGVPDHILLKPARLDAAEFETMKQHPRMGHRILSGSQSPLLQMAADIALHHHEKYDGSGYPQGLRGEAIPLTARIVAVADVFDALTSARPYKPAWEISRAVDFLRDESGRHFDPRCVDAFLDDFDAVLAIRDRYRDETLQQATP